MYAKRNSWWKRKAKKRKKENISLLYSTTEKWFIYYQLNSLWTEIEKKKKKKHPIHLLECSITTAPFLQRRPGLNDPGGFSSQQQRSSVLQANEICLVLLTVSSACRSFFWSLSSSVFTRIKVSALTRWLRIQSGLVDIIVDLKCDFNTRNMQKIYLEIKWFNPPPPPTIK